MLYIHGMGHFHPENKICNKFLEDLDIGTNHQWIIERVGIENRHTVLDLEYIKQTKNHDTRGAAEASLYTNAETGKRAAEMAIARAGIDKGQIGMVIAGGCTPENSTPAEACAIAAELEISAPCIDLNSACSSFGAHIHFLSMLNDERVPDFLLIVSPENTTRTVDYSDRRGAVLWGDGTSAAVVSTKIPGKAVIRSTSLISDPSGWNKVVIPRTGHFDQDGPAVQAFAVKKTSLTVKSIKERYNGKANDIRFIGHQANLRMLENVCRRCDISSDRHFFNVSQFGNTAAAGAPTVLSQNWDHFHSGDVLAMVMVGAGLTWAGLSVEFNTED
ncbi:ketoacyl-ACP synthase III [candidate division KSB1 bacterium]|nr:ketoacyl-ACP synthase III [candidate division KSB1 bacterium]